MKEIFLAGMGELTLKGQNRKMFEAALMKTLRHRCHGLGQFRIHSSQSLIYIQPQDEVALASCALVYERLRRVFGIATLVRAAQCEKDFATICHTAAEYLAPQLEKGGRFKVTARRADKAFPMNSPEIMRELGAFLLGRFPALCVDVHSPDITVAVDVREKAAFIHAGKEAAAGGLPIPCSGRAAVLLSGGIDSPVAAWLMAKRGLSVVAIHFASPPYTSPRAAAKVDALADILAPWCGPLPQYTVAYTKAQEYLRDNLIRQEYFTVMMRRSMLRIAAMIAQKEQCHALITGESLAQVASQTLQALACTNTAQALPVLRPCIGMDKNEITTIAQRIGSYETSILPYEDCCTIFTPPHPKTKPHLADVERMEAAMPQLPRLEEEAAESAIFALHMPVN